MSCKWSDKEIHGKKVQFHYLHSEEKLSVLTISPFFPHKIILWNIWVSLRMLPLLECDKCPKQHAFHTWTFNLSHSITK